MNVNHSLDLFADAPERPGGLGCRVEIAATMADALKVAAAHGLDRDAVAERMAFHLGDKFNPATLNGYTAPSHTEKAEQPRDISLLRAMAFDAALNKDVLLGLYARKRGERRVITADEAIFIELGHIHQQERQLAERKRALQTLLKGGRP
jgi:hypothetical protein